MTLVIAKSRTICIVNQWTGYFTIGERYSQTDHNVCSEVPFNKNCHYIRNNQLICTENQLTGFCVAQVSIERHF